MARLPAASLLRRLERCRPSSTNSVALATAAGVSLPASAITDTTPLIAAQERSEKAATPGIQPLIGSQLTVAFGVRPQRHHTHASTLSGPVPARRVR